MTLLARALTTNAAFSGVSGLVLALAAAPVAARLGTAPAWPLRVLGVGLLAFAGLVALTAWRPKRRAVVLVIAADVAWVAASAGLLSVAPAWLARDGAVLVAGVALAVALLALAQTMGLARTPHPERMVA